jgi:DNA-binding GntR family transcriptional regulator
MSNIVEGLTALTDELRDKRLLERWREAGGLAAADSTADGIRRAIADAIVNRELPPGLRLGEERLASLFGVSRTPVREALLNLVNSRLVTRDSRGLLRVGSVTSEDIVEIYAVRVALEGFAAASAATLAPPTALVRLRQLNLACRRSGQAGNFSELAVDNLRFHEAIAAASGNRLLVRFTQEISDWIKRIPSTTLSHPGRAPRAIEQHTGIIKAIEQRDSERAERLAREHMEAALKIRMAMLMDADDVAEQALTEINATPATGDGARSQRARSPRRQRNTLRGL